MFKELKKRTILNMIWIFFICLASGVLCLATGFKDAITVLKGATDITNASIKTIKNTDYAEITLDKYNVYGCFSEQYSSESSSKVESYYYLVVVGDDYDARFMAVEVDAKDYNKMLKIEDEYTAMDNGEDLGTTTTVVVKGKLTSMKSELYTNFKECLIDTYNYGYSDIKIVSLNLVVDEGSLSFSDTILFLVGIILIIVSLIALIITFTNIPLAKLKKQLEAQGPAYMEYVENDFMNATNYGKFRIGKEFTFFVKGMKCIIIPNSEIVWAYPTKTTHKTNGLKTGTSYSVKVFTIYKKAYELPTSDDDKTNEVIDVYSSLTDTIVLGYDVSLEQMYAKRFNEFLDIAYNNHNYGEKENENDINE